MSSARAEAQGAPPPPPPHWAPIPLQSSAPPRPYAKPAMRTAGMAVSLAGAGMTALGVTLLGVGMSTNHCHCFFSSSDSGIGLYGPLAGTILAGIGALHGIVGAALWGAGAQPPRASFTRRALPSVAAGPGSITLAWEL